jgi:glyoxylase-like metal-dependent hydrolase (beta-lactamase superfamily II)
MIPSIDLPINFDPCGPLGTNIYVAYVQQPTVDGKKGVAVVVDAPPDSFEKHCNLFQSYDVHLFLTHGHWDHTADAARFQEAGARVYAHSADRNLYEHPELMRPYAVSGTTLSSTTPDEWVEEDRDIRLGDRTVTLLHTPGHTPGQIAVSLPGVLFVGDTLFRESVGRTDLPGGDHRILLHSILHKLFALPDSTIVYPGHGPSTSIGHEKRFNPYVNVSPDKGEVHVD